MKNNKPKKAVALKYEASRDGAPRVTAKGKSRLAERIIELAQREGVPIAEDPDLVAVLSELDWYEEIPPPLYHAVAEILAFAYRLNQKVKEG
jgi:flagellar biosynthesis protein